MVAETQIRKDGIVQVPLTYSITARSDATPVINLVNSQQRITTTTYSAPPRPPLNNTVYSRAYSQASYDNALEYSNPIYWIWLGDVTGIKTTAEQVAAYVSAITFFLNTQRKELRTIRLKVAVHNQSKNGGAAHWAKHFIVCTTTTVSQ